jgi:hypothetical protein
MKRLVVLLLALGLILGFQSDSLAKTQPSDIPVINGGWLFDLSGVEQGGAVITFVNTARDDVTEAGTFTGYGVGKNEGPIELQDGAYVIDVMKGSVNGFCTVVTHSFTEVITFSGKTDKKRAKISIKFTNGPNAKGIKLISDPPPGQGVDGNWLVTGSGQGGLRVTLDPLTVGQDNPAISRVYTIDGTGVTNDPEHAHIAVTGRFFLTGKSVAYGVYAVEDTDLLEEIETGVFTGKINLSSRTFVLKLISTEGNKSTMKGQKQ